VTGATERFDLLGFDVTLLNGGPAGSFSVQRWQAPGGAGGIPIHLHRQTEEAFYVVDGEIGLWLDDHAVVLPAGSFVLVPPGRHHSFWNPGERPATYITVMAPSGFERYLVELAVGLRQVADDEQVAALRERLAKAYDITVVGPAPAPAR
jgi:mannose-6-phosphate isomerase-like protein (cupin superfamily)